MTASQHGHKLSRLRTALLCGALIVLGWHCFRFRDFCVDDAVISFTYARNFAHGHGLVHFPGGERVEGYTNFLWVVLLAAGIRLGADVFVYAKVLGAALAGATAIGSAELLASLRGARSPLDAFAALLLALLTPVAYWSMSGLENPLYMALTIGCAVRLLHERRMPDRPPLSAVLAAALGLTRPDGLLLVGIAGGFRLAGDRRLTRLVAWYAIALVPIGAHFLWRYFYYGFPFPNTFYVKVDGSFHWSELWDFKAPGWRYVLSLSDRYRVIWLLVPALASLLPRRAGMQGRLLGWMLLEGVVFFPLYAKGDWMSEGRFVSSAWALLAALAIDGCEGIVAAIGWLLGRVLTCSRPLVSPRLRSILMPAAAGLLACSLFFPVVRTSLAHSAARVGHYPVPVQTVANRARIFTRLANDNALVAPTALEGDLGATSYFSGMQIIDLGCLADLTMARLRGHPAVLREYIFGERRPTLMRLTDVWLSNGLQLDPEFDDQYIPIRLREPAGAGISMRRTVFTTSGIDTRAPLGRLSAAGVAVLGSERTDHGRSLWLLVEPASVRAPLFIEPSGQPRGQQVLVRVGQGYYRPVDWREGEVLVVRTPVPAGPAEPMRICDGAGCVELGSDSRGAAPVGLPRPASAVLDRALARGEWMVAFTTALALGRPLNAIADALFARATAARAAGDNERAFRDFLAVVRLDPARPFAQKQLLELRLMPRDAYQYRWEARLDKSMREFALHSDAAHLTALVRDAVRAGQPAAAVAAHLATGLIPVDAPGRMELSQALLDLGLPERALPLLPVTPPTLEAAVLMQRIALLAGDVAMGRRIAQAVARQEISVAPGIALVAAGGRMRASGMFELTLGLRRVAPRVSALLMVAGRPLAWEREPARWSEGEVVLERVGLDLASGTHRIAVGSGSVEVALVGFSTDFELGRLDGWIQTGEAFRQMPRQFSPGRPIRGFRGIFFLDTYASGGGDRALGELHSLPLSPAVAAVCLVVGGGDTAAKVDVALIAGSQVVATASGQRDERLREHCLAADPVAAPAGEPLRIAVRDHGAEPWGHILVDDFECLDSAGRGTPCAGGVRAIRILPSFPLAGE